MPGWISFALFLAGGLFRISGFTASPFWYDEAYSIYISRLPDLMIRLKNADFNPPLWQIILFPFIKVFGETAFALRIPSLLASLLAILVSWKLICWVDEKHHKPFAVTFCSLLIALLPYQWWQAQDGRGYALMSLLYVLGIYFIIQKKWIGFCVSITLLAYSQSIALFYIIALVTGAILLQPDQIKKIFASSVLALLLFLPWIPVMINTTSQFYMSNFYWTDIVKSLVFVFFTGMFQGNLANFALLLIVISFVIAIIFSAKPIFRSLSTLIHKRDIPRNLDEESNIRYSVITVWAVLPILLMIMSAPFKNVVYYRALSAALIPSIIWLGFTLIPQKINRAGFIFVSAWVFIIFAGIVVWSPTLKGGDLKEIAQVINRSWEPRDVIYHATGTSYLPFSLYLDHQAYLINEIQSPGLLQTGLITEFKIPQSSLEGIQYKRAWIIWARDQLVSDRVLERMTNYTKNAVLVGSVHYWQAATIDIYLLKKVSLEEK